MVTIPQHFKDEFDWIIRPRSNLKVQALTTRWLGKEIIYLIFRTPENKLDDLRVPIIKALHTLSIEKQICYIKTIAKHLADAAITTPLPTDTRGWLNDVCKSAKELHRLLSGKHKKQLPGNWNNLCSLIIQIIKKESKLNLPFPEELLASLKKENLKVRAKGNTNLTSVMNLVIDESKALTDKKAMAFYKFPQTFFEEISKDNPLFLSYQRNAIQAISKVNQEYFDKPYDALTAYVLSCIFLKDISKQSVKKIREK